MSERERRRRRPLLSAVHVGPSHIEQPSAIFVAAKALQFVSHSAFVGKSVDDMPTEHMGLIPIAVALHR